MVASILMVLNSFQVNDLFLQPPKTARHPEVFWNFQGVTYNINKSIVRNGLMKVQV